MIKAILLAAGQSKRLRSENKLDRAVILEDIKKRKELSDLALIKQSRLSVMPIDYKSWKIINKTKPFVCNAY